MTDRIIRFFTSLRLTVLCLAVAIVIVFLGTLAQVQEGLYQAQERYFRSFLVWWGPQNASWKIPVFPGGYLVGLVLLINLTAAHFKRFRLSWDKFGIHLTHLGLILLLLGQLATDLFSIETHLRFREGETKNYSESHMENELAFLTDSGKEGSDLTVTIPEYLLTGSEPVRHPQLPFIIRVKEYHPNCELQNRPADAAGPPAATQGIGPRATIVPLPPTKKLDERNFPCVVVELTTAEGSLGTWLLSPWLAQPQTVTTQGKTWRMNFRWKRFYMPYAMELLQTTHEVYRGTDIPKNFQSRVRIINPVTGENREVDIFMNNPLRYQGLTYYQYQMGRDEANANVGVSTLQVVRNPSWLTPYLACLLVGAGLTVQFMMHLISFLHRRRKS